jgi:hypothetical protein
MLLLTALEGVGATAALQSRTLLLHCTHQLHGQEQGTQQAPMIGRCGGHAWCIRAPSCCSADGSFNS